MKHIVFRQFFRDFCSAAISPAVFLLSVALLVLLSAGCSREDEVSGKKIGKGGAVQFTATGGTPSATTKSSADSSGEAEQSYTIYYDFEKGENVASPQGGVSHGSDGNLTQSSDTRFSGEVFETTVSGVYAEYLDWVEGDKITIAQKGNLEPGNGYENLSSNYEVKNPTRKDDPKRSTATLTPVTGNGLQWREGTNYFAALYPDLGLTAVSTAGGSSSYKASFSGTYEVMPSTQYCTLVGSRNYQDKTGSTKAETWYAPNMRYAYMAAGVSGVSSSGTPLTLSFYPQFSSVEVKLVKPASLSEATVKLTSAVLTGGNGGSTDASLSGSPQMTLANATGLEVAGGSAPSITHTPATATYGNSITMKFKQSDDTTPAEPELNETTPVSFTFLMLPANDLNQLELKLELKVTKGGITTTEAKTIKLQTVSATKTWIPLPAGKKLTITNMSTWIVDVVGPSAFTEKNFSVSADKKVKFSPGNLQAVIAEGHDDSAEGARWQFADKQYDFPSRADNEDYSAAAGTTVDLFMHPQSGDVTDPNAYAFGIPIRGSYFPATSTFVDWGEHLSIFPNSTSTTAYAKNTYRTLKQKEWAYLLNQRTSGANVGGTNNARYSKVTLNVGGTTGTISGLLIYPDGFTWTSAMGTAPVVNSPASDFNTSSAYTLAQFEAMESAGVVFLPAAGVGFHSSGGAIFNGAGHECSYWSADVYNGYHAYNLRFNDSNVNASDYYMRKFGFSVRLVRDVDNFTVSSDGKMVKFSPGNLQAVIAEGHDDSAEGARWQFADNQYDFPSRANNEAYSAVAGKTVDLFMYPESGDVTVPYAFGIPQSSSYRYRGTTLADWGEYLDIYPNSDPTSTPYAKNTYRTLTRNEWAYLFHLRPSGATVGRAHARYSLINLNVGGTTGTIFGMLIYPDGFTWDANTMGAVPTYVNSNAASTVPYTLAQFEAMESAGVIFLPAAGYCDYYTSVFKEVGSSGLYWADSPEHVGTFLYFLYGFVAPNYSNAGYPTNSGMSVRLVQNVN